MFEHQPIRRQAVTIVLTLLVPFILSVDWSVNLPRIEHGQELTEQAGSVAAAAGAYLNVTRLQTLFSDVPLPEGSVVKLFDATRRVLARSGEAELHIGKSAAPHPTAPCDVPRTQVKMGLDGVQRTDGNALVERGPWLLSVGIPTGLVLERLTPLLRRSILIVVTAIIMMTLEVAEHAQGRILIRVFDAGKRVRLELDDDGPGVMTEDEPKPCQPFFTTKPVGNGTGLGLSVSYGIIDSYGGTIGHRSNDWGGATFLFELPAPEPAIRPPSSSSRTTSSRADDRPPLLHGPVSPNV